METTPAYRSLSGSTRFLQILLGVCAVVGLANLVSSWMQYELLSRAPITEAEGEANDTRQQIVGLLHTASYVVTAIVFGVWIYRAHKNLRALGARGLQFTPGWAVGCFFVPILNLWKPYQAMKELWQASYNPMNLRVVDASPLLGLWWGLWIIYGVLSQVSFRATLAANTIKSVKVASVLEVVSELPYIPVCLVAMVLVGEIVQGQNRSHAWPEALDLERFSPRPQDAVREPGAITTADGSGEPLDVNIRTERDRDASV